MDVLQLSVETVTFDDHKSVQEVVYTINGQNLIDILCDIETPHVVRDRVMPLPGVDLNDPALLARYRKWAATYMGINLSEFQESSAAFLGNPTPHGWATLLKCSGCGDIGCTSFAVRATRSADLIQWAEFTSWRKGWAYDTMPQFTFDAAQYETETTRILSA